MKKYQFCIRFDTVDKNSAASKAVLDCNAILSLHGYQDYTLTVGDNANRPLYYYQLLKELIRFFLSIKAGSLVAIQYPLLSINAIFKYFIRLARLKKVRFFCIIHDIESLRTGGMNKDAINKEVELLLAYDILIVHNAEMEAWLRTAGVSRPMVQLGIFDYLKEADKSTGQNDSGKNGIVYAGNLLKSSFIYNLNQVPGTQFNVYGPNFDKDRAFEITNLTYFGEYEPDEIVCKISGKFGLLWDGAEIDDCDAVMGNYLKYNSPHKCSLYLAAGIPVIAPSMSAAGKFIKENQLGFVIDNLHELEAIEIDPIMHALMLQQVALFQADIITGKYLQTALDSVEAI